VSSSSTLSGPDGCTGEIATAPSAPATGPTSSRSCLTSRELANKSKSRLDAILNLHTNWIIAHKSAALIHICGDQDGFRRIERAADRVGLPANNGLLRIELLDTIKTQTRNAFEQARAGITTAA
jgi:hypothetical protein